MPSPALCSVCIATYRRPVLLEQLLLSLFKQRLPEGIAVELVVVDNDAEGSAIPVIEKYQTSRFPIVHAIEPRQNISHARNKTVVLARGEYLFFIDDDETADENWMSTLLDALHRYNADVVFGDVITTSDNELPQWIIEHACNDQLTGANGITHDFRGAGNMAIRNSWLTDTAMPFNPEYGLTGGEDLEFFSRLQQRGAVFATCKEAIIRHTIVPERLTLKAIMYRHLCRGASRYRIIILASPNPHYARIGQLFLSGATVSVGFLLSLLYTFSRSKRWKYRLLTIRHCGRFLAVFGFKPKPYINIRF